MTRPARCPHCFEPAPCRRCLAPTIRAAATDWRGLVGIPLAMIGVCGLVIMIGAMIYG